MTETTKASSLPSLRQVRAAEGEPFDVAGVKFLWKAKGEDTQRAFTIIEQTLLTGESVPPHSHPYTEFFYVLEGTVVFRQVSGSDDAESHEGLELRCAAGDAVVVPPGAVHTFGNSDEPPARVLGVSNYKHQEFFDAVQQVDAAVSFGSLPLAEAMMRVTQIGREHSMFFEPPVS